MPTDRPRISDEELRQWTNRADDAGRLARELSALRTREAGWQTMDTAPKDRTPVLALIRRDLAEVYPHYGLSSPEIYAGLQVVVRHPGLAKDGFDVGWGLAGPFGQGLGPDQVFEGWMPLPAPPALSQPTGEGSA